MTASRRSSGFERSTRAGTIIAVARTYIKPRAHAAALLAVVLVATSLVLTPYSAEAQVDATCGDVAVTASGGATALDGAIVAANACPGPQTITVEAGTYARRTTFEPITDDLTIVGDAAVRPVIRIDITGTYATTFRVEPGATVEFENLVFDDPGGFSCFVCIESATVVIRNVQMNGSFPGRSEGNVAAVWARASALTIENSEINNSDGSAIIGFGGTHVIATDTAITGSSGKGISTDTLVATRVEISGGGEGVNVSGEVTLADSYIWNNTGAGFKQGTRTTSIITNTVFGRDPDGNAGPNGIGVTAFGEMRMSNSVVANSVNQGIEVYPGYLAPASFIDVQVLDNGGSGLSISAATSAEITRVTISGNGAQGLYLLERPATVKDSSITANGTDCSFFRTTAVDAGGNSDSDGTCGFAVPNDAPIAVADQAGASPTETIVIDVLANDTDADGDELTVVSVTSPNATVVTEGKRITYTAPLTFTGETFSYTITDPLGETATAEVVVELSCGDITVTPAGGGAALHAAVDLTEVCPGAQTIFLEPGTYILDTGFEISDELTITGTDPTNPAHLELRAAPLITRYVFFVTDAAGPFTGRNLSIDATAPWSLGYFSNTDAELQRVGFQTMGEPLGCSFSVQSAVRIFGGQLTFDTSQLLRPSCNGIYVGPAASAHVTSSFIAGALGQGIDNHGILTMTDSQVAENSVDGVTSSGVGNEVRIDGSFIWGNGYHGIHTTGFALVTDSAIGLRPEAGELVSAGNVRSGISSNGPLNVDNVYIAHNEDGIAHSGASPAAIADSTIYNNRSSGLRIEGTTVTTVSGTSLSSNNPNCEILTSAIMNDAGGNVDDDGTCGINHSPIAVDETYRIDEDESLDVPPTGVLANDSDEDGDSLTAELVQGPTHASSFELLPSGAFSYVPEADYAGEDTFVYRASDGTFGDEATVTIVLDPINDAPTLEMDETATATLGEATSLSVRVADVDADDSELYGFDATTPAVQLQVEHGTLTATPFGAAVAPPSGSTIAVAGEVESINKTLATLIYTPDAGYLGPDTLTVTIDDRGENGLGGGLQATGSTLITVVEQNDPPIPANESFETDEDTVLTVAAPGVLNNDIEPEGDDMTAILVTGTSSGIVNLEPDGAFVYEPLADFSGTDQFTYNVSDGVNLSIDATVTITVLPIDDDVRATATPESLTFDEDASGQITVTLFDPDSSLDDVAVTAAVVDSTLAMVAVEGVGTTRTVTVTGQPDAHGNTLVQIGYGHGSPSALLIVPVTITPVNDPPTILPIDDQSTNEDTPFSFQIAIDDAETDVADLVLTITSTDDGLATITRTLQSPGLHVIPLPDTFGNTTVTVTVSDGDAEASTTFELVIVAVNDPPLGVPDSYTATEDTPLQVDDRALGVLGNDSDPNDGDPDGTTLTAVDFTDPQHGSLVGRDDGTFSYEPDTGFFGQDQFTYMASDGEDQTSPVTVTITVEPVDDPPTAEPDYYSTDEDVPLLVPPPGVLGNDADTDTPAAELWAVIDSGPATGQLTLAPGGGFTYIPEANVFGLVTFDYYVADATTDSAPVTVSIDVQPVNDPPVIQAPDMVETLEATPISFDVVIADVETPVASLDLTALVDDPTAGVVMVGEPDVDGVTQITFTPTAGPGPTVLTLSLLDSPTATPVTAMVTVVVLSSNQAPTAILSALVTVVEGSGDVTIDATGSTDPDGDVLTYTFTPLAGLVDNGDGTAVFSDTQDDGVFEIAVEVCDPADACDTAQAEITVLNAAPQLDVDLSAAALAGLAVDLDATFTDAGVEDTHGLTVDWGDGTVETVVDAGPTTTLTHTFVAAGAYVVVVTVVDDDGGQDLWSASVEVADAGLLINTTDDGADTDPGDGVCFTGEFLADGRAACSLRAAIEETSVRIGSKVIDVPAGIYSADTEILISSYMTLVGSGRNETIIDAPLHWESLTGQLTLRSHTLVSPLFLTGRVDLADMAVQNVAAAVRGWAMSDTELTGGSLEVVLDLNADNSTIEGAVVTARGVLDFDTVDFLTSRLNNYGEGSTIVGSTIDSALVTGAAAVAIELSDITNSQILGSAQEVGIVQSLVVDTRISVPGSGTVRIAESDLRGGRVDIGQNQVATITNSTIGSVEMSLHGQLITDSSLLSLANVRIYSGSTSLVNSTVDGGIVTVVDSISPSSLSVVSSTVAAAIEVDADANLDISNSYVATCDIAAGATLTMNDSADGDGSCVTGALAGIDPLLGPLQDNGGQTHTFALLENSPLLDAVAAGAECPATDQRGEPRPFDADDDGTATCDIGAFEAQTVLTTQNRPPVAVLPAAFAVDEGSGDVTIDATGSTDPDGDSLTYGFTPLAGLVDNGDGTAVFSDTADDAVFPIAVEVCDLFAACAGAQLDLTVQNVAPQLVVQFPIAGLAGLEIELDIAFSDVGVDDTHELLVDWGDDTIETFGADLATARSHIFVGGGSYEITVTLVDDDGGQDIVSSAIEIFEAGLQINTTDDGADTDPGDGVCFTGAFLDDGRPACSLRAAIEETNELAGEQTLDVPAGVYTAASESPDISVTDDLTLVGAGRTATRIEVPLIVRLAGQLTLQSHTQMRTQFRYGSGRVHLIDMDMQNASGYVDVWRMSDSEVRSTSFANLMVAHDLTVENSTIAGLSVWSLGVLGIDTVEITDAQLFLSGSASTIASSRFESITMFLSNSAALTVELTEIANSHIRLGLDGTSNSALSVAVRQSRLIESDILVNDGAMKVFESEMQGGTAHIWPDASLVIARSTITAATIWARGTFEADSSLLSQSRVSTESGSTRIVNSTVDGGAIRADPTGAAAVVSIDSSTVVAKVSVQGSAALDVSNSYVDECDIAGSASAVAINSADSDGSCVSGPHAGIDPMLGLLQDNGGPTETFALLQDSPLLDAVPADAACRAVDQRGEPRPFDADDDGTATCDIGSLEAQTILTTPPQPLVLTSPASVVITEDGEGATLTFGISEYLTPFVAVDVRWRPVSGSPTAGSCSILGLGGNDIGGTFGTRIVNAQGGTIAINVSGCPDNQLESDKVIDVVITTLSGVEVGSTRVTVLDDDEPPELRLLDVTIQEGDPTGPLLLDFNRVGTLSVEVVRPPERDYMVRLRPRAGDGSVSFGLSCVPVPLLGAPDAISGPFQPVTIPADAVAGSILKFDQVMACRNQNPDPPRSYAIEVVDGPFESGGVDDRAIVTIEDDDGGVASSDSRVSISNASVTEGNSGSKTVTVDVTVAADSIPLGLTWATSSVGPTASQSASGGSDYVTDSGELFFSAQGGTQTIELTVLGDELVEGDEWFRVVLYDDAGVKLTAEANVRIRDDEYIAIRVLDAPEVVEGDSGLRTMTFTVTASAEPPASATFYLGTHDAVDASLVPLDPGRASAGSDYNSKYATVTFGPGRPLSQEFTVSVRGDHVTEQSEAIYIAVAAFGGPGYTSTTVERSTAVGIIRDDDGPPIITGPEQLLVTMGEPATTVPVVYPVTARDSESNVVPVVCSPSSGSQFAAGTHLAKCTATDSSGNTATLTITIVVSKGRGDRLTGLDGLATSQTLQGSTVQVTANGYAATSFVTMELRSDPLDLGQAQADADGTVKAWVTIPADAPIGAHTIAVIGVTADGVPLQVLLPVEVQRRSDVVALYPAQSIVTDSAADAVAAIVPTAVPELATVAVEPLTPSPSGPLAYTGAAAVGLLQLALMLLGAGCTLAAESRRRRP